MEKGSIFMNVWEAAISYRSIRRFKDIALPYDVLEKYANAGWHQVLGIANCLST